MSKYEEFLEDANPEEFPVKIAARSVGLQEIEEEDATVQEINLSTSARVWVLNESTQVLQFIVANVWSITSSTTHMHA